MNEQVKKQWIEALRSGAYKQGEGTLRRNDQYCCLGVLCDLYDKEHENCHWQPYDEDEDHNTFFDGNETNAQFLPLCVMRWAELDSGDPEVITEDDYDYETVDTLSNLNDTEHTFGTISDYIEEQL